MGVRGLRDDLLRLLRDVYNFKTESYVLNANDTPQAIARDFRYQIMQFTNVHQPKTDNAKHLLVYYYSGHSDCGPHGDQLRLG